MSTKNLPVTPKPLAQKVRGEDCVRTGTRRTGVAYPHNANLQDAIDKAIAQVPGANAMTDLSISADAFVIPLIYNRYCITVDGSVVVFEASQGAH
jgi:hypothetical protein